MKFARESGEIADTLDVAILTRLKDELFEPAGRLNYRLQGIPNLNGKPALLISVDGTLILRCRRCLGPVEYRARTNRKLELVAEGAPLADPALEPEDIEQIPAQTALDVTSLVEDEIILGLPMVVGHPEGVCELPGGGDRKDRHESPFEALSDIKTGSKRFN